jgi:hypothetical protein
VNESKSPGLEISWVAVRYGALVIAMFAGPCVILAQVVSDRPSHSGVVSALLFFGVVFGFAVGGFGAARARPDAPLAHGILAAVVAFSVIQGLGVVRRLIAGNSLHVGSMLFSFMVATVAAMAGAMLVNSRGNRARQQH